MKKNLEGSVCGTNRRGTCSANTGCVRDLETIAFGAEWTFQTFSIDIFALISISDPKLSVTSAGSLAW